MFILGNLLAALATVCNVVINLLMILIFIRAVISWVNPDPLNPIVQFLHRTTDPILDSLRRIIPFRMNLGIDISPILAFILLLFAQRFIVATLFDVSLRLR